MMTTLAAAALAAPAAALGRYRVMVAMAVAAALSAAFLAVGVYAGGPDEVGGFVGPVAVTAVADRLTVVLLVVVLGIAAVVLSFARRYLQGDPQQRRTLAGLAAMGTATATMVSAGTLAGFAVAWTVASLVLWSLLSGAPGVGAGAARRRAGWTFLVADGALWAAVALTAQHAGDVRLGTAAHELPGATAVLVACLLVFAAVGRSALVPLHRWLPAAGAAPTPVSALLHAGVVNAGGILLLRTAPISSASDAAMGIAFFLGATSMVLGTAMMLVRPDVKGALAHSTVAQMGFLIMTCSLGAYAAAVVHLAGHAMYKATLFLGSGSVVERLVRAAKAPPAPRPPRRRLPIGAIGAIGAPGVVLLAGSALWPGLDRPSTAVVAFAALTAAVAGAAWIHRGGAPGGALAGLSGLAVAYLGLVIAAHAALDPALPAAGSGVAPVELLAVPAAGLAALAWLRTLAPTARGAALASRCYTWALAAGDPLTRHQLPKPAQIRPGIPAPPQVTPGGPERVAERVGLHAEVAIAAQILTPAWPLQNFVAVNPLGGLVHRPFEQALAALGAAYGIEGTLPEADFRAAHAAGRVSTADLVAALRRRHPHALTTEPVRLGGLERTPTELLVADLLHGPTVKAPQRRLRTAAERVDARLADEVDAHLARWCAAYFDTGQAAWPMPGRAAGFYAAWHRLVRTDPTLPPAVQARLAAMPAPPEDALLHALSVLGVGPGGERLAHLRAHLLRMPGWATHIRWRADVCGDGDLLDFLAVRAAYEAALVPCAARTAPPEAPVTAAAGDPLARAARVSQACGVADPTPGELSAVAAVLDDLPAEARALVWQQAYEAGYQAQLLAGIAAASGATPGGAAGRDLAAGSDMRPHAQVFCCIDVRAEGLRRQLEALGNYQTFGFAGFFGVPISFQDLAGGEPDALCPVLISPAHAVREAPLDSAAAARHVAGRARLARAEGALSAAKSSPAAKYALAEVGGLTAGPITLARTFAPAAYAALRDALVRWVAPPAVTTPSVGGDIPLDQRVLYSEAMLRMTGLTAGFARIVVLCAHGSRTANNPYAAALACGACGGSPGGANARTAAAILNRTEVRAELSSRGITIPPDTWFAAAEHDTVRDEVSILNPADVPASHRADLDRVVADLAAAGAALAAERLPTLPGAPTGADAVRHVRARGADWAQVFPEWGLAGNAAFVIGPRRLTAGLDLDRRCFLHSYDPACDPSGAGLETILTAPVIVAQWVNMQYYASTVAPELFGAGCKPVHNVTGGIGVVAGAGGDLRLGLPLQSVSDGHSLAHEPMRLLVLTQAPTERVAEIVANNPSLRHLVANEWITLLARATDADRWVRWTDAGWTPETVSPTVPAPIATPIPAHSPMEVSAP